MRQREEKGGGTAEEGETKERLEVVLMWSATFNLSNRVLSFHLRAYSRHFRKKAYFYKRSHIKTTFSLVIFKKCMTLKYDK